jgi:CBS domain
MAGHSTWRVTGCRITGAVPEEVRAGQPAPAIVANVMRPPLTVEQAAAAAYLMKDAGATALLVLDGHTDQPIGIITQADITRAVADGKDVNRVRIYDLMTTRPAVISTTTSVRDAANAARRSRMSWSRSQAGWPAGIPAPLRADQGGAGPAPRARQAGWPTGPAPADKKLRRRSGCVASWENGRRRTAHQTRTAPHEAGRDDRRA